jgi:hypothetical protein
METPMSKWEKLTVLAGVVFFCLLNYPLLQVFNSDVTTVGGPTLVVYLFAVWIAAIIMLVWLGRRLKSQA